MYKLWLLKRRLGIQASYTLRVGWNNTHIWVKKHPVGRGCKRKLIEAERKKNRGRLIPFSRVALFDCTAVFLSFSACLNPHRANGGYGSVSDVITSGLEGRTSQITYYKAAALQVTIHHACGNILASPFAHKHTLTCVHTHSLWFESLKKNFYLLRKHANRWKWTHWSLHWYIKNLLRPAWTCILVLDMRDEK